jgi:ABC-type lipoprotein release transport system permease subunit
MKLTHLTGRNLLFHWRGNSPVLMGVLVGAAVLTGALLVGDSLRGSLRAMAEEQLGWVDQALVAGRFLRANLSEHLPASRVAPAIMLQGSMTLQDPTSMSDAVSRRASGVMILGVDDRFWQGVTEVEDASFWNGNQAEVVLNQALAQSLDAHPGSQVTLYLQKVSAVPRETLLGRRDASEVLDEIRLRVRNVLPSEGLGRFSLNPSPQTVRNAFLPLKLLQKHLGQPGKANAFFAAGGSAALQETLGSLLSLEDWGLVLHTPESRTRDLVAKLDRNHDGRLESSEWRRRISSTMAELADLNHDGILEQSEILDYYRRQHSYISLESRQMILEPAVAEAAKGAAEESRLPPAPTLVYLANSISKAEKSIPYSVVAALDPALPPPLGPFLPKGIDALGEGEIILADWKDSSLRARPGDVITLTFFEPEQEGQLREVSRTFKLRGFVPLEGAANDPDLTPEFPGITDKLDLRDWNPPFPYHNDRVGRRDELFWENYRTTPKAYVTLADGQGLWGSRFGSLTSIRLAPLAGPETAAKADLTSYAEGFERRLLAALRPERGGMVFDNVRQRALEGSSGANDFGWLFLGFSCFLIGAALLLVGLLFRLNIDRRAPEIGLLLATGYRRGVVRRLLLLEGGILAVLGGLLGLAGALVYAWLMLRLLRAWWPGGLGQSFLHLHVTALSLLVGFFVALAVSILTIFWAVHVLGRVAPTSLLRGESVDAPLPGGTRRAGRWSRWILVGAAVGALACLCGGFTLNDQEARASTFLLGGALFLTAGLAGIHRWMLTARPESIGGHGNRAVARLGVRNAARNPMRSLLTAGLLASATFLIIAVGSFYRDPGRRFLDLHGGSGGFTLLAESDVPIYQDLNSAKGKDELNFSDRVAQELEGIAFFPFRVHQGEDASCLNLYQPKSPRVLGVPSSLIQRGGFEFKATMAGSAETRANPWLLLEQPQPDGEIPVIGEANSSEWVLHKHLGDELEVLDEAGKQVRLRVVALLQDSVFQSGLIVSQANFLKLYPRQQGFQFFLVQAPLERMRRVQELLETTLADHGFTTMLSVDRLASYLAVENTYLSTFQALGGLGLLLGALGLAIVLLRNIWERRGELALLRALGFRQRVLGWLVLAENAFLLILGLSVGTATALLSVAPHLLSGGSEIPWLRLALVLLAVMAVGLSAGTLAVATTLRAPLLAALRQE